MLEFGRGGKCRGWHRHEWDLPGKRARIFVMRSQISILGIQLRRLFQPVVAFWASHWKRGLLPMVNCDSLKSAVIEYVQTETEVLSLKRSCLLSLPIKALDGAHAEVFIEERGADSFLVHDGGKTVGHLEASGIHVTERLLDVLAQLAVRLGVSLDNGVFKMLSKAGTIQDAAFAVGQCCSVGLYELLAHSAVAEEARIISRVSNDVDLQGELVQVGGRDETISIHIRSDADTYICTGTREQGREISQYLFTPIRVHGEARWMRGTTGSWKLISFTLRSFRPLLNAGIVGAIDALRELGRKLEVKPNLTFLDDEE